MSDRGNKLGLPDASPREIGGSARKMMERANAGLGQPIAPHLFTTQPERDLYDRVPDRNVRVIDDVTRGLGLDRVDEQRIQALITGTRVQFDTKSHDRWFMAVQKLTEALRRSYRHIESRLRNEIVLRARAYWRNNNAVDYSKDPTMRYRARGAVMKSEKVLLTRDGRMLLVKATPVPPSDQQKPQQAMGAEKPPAGFVAIPNSKKGGYKSPDGKTYWYPDGKGVRGHAEEEGGGDPKHGQPPTGASTGAKPMTGGAPKGPGKPGAGPPQQGGPQKPGAMGAGGAGGDGHPEPKFSPAPDGADADEQINHHVQQRQAHLAAKRKFAKKDPKRAAAHHKAANEHTRAANPLLKQKHMGAKGGAGAAGGGAPVGDDEDGPQTAPGGAQQPPPAGDEDEGGQPPMGAGAPPPAGAGPGTPGAMGGAHPFDQETQEGYSRSPSGVRTDERGNRMTAAKPRDRHVPEGETVRKTRESLGRALNVMADLSSAHDHMGALQKKLALVKQGKDPETGGPIDPRLARRHVSMLQAEMAAAKHDIVQLEDAHDHAMKELKSAQQQMMLEGIESHPIFQAFIQLMEKLGSFGDKLAGMVDPESERKTNEQQIAAKQGEGEADFGALDQKGDANASEADKNDGPTNVLGIDKGEIDKMFGQADDNVKQQAMQAFDTLQKLAAKHGAVDGPSDAGDEDGAPSQFGAESTDDDNASDLIAQLGKEEPLHGDEENPAANAASKQVRGSIEDDDGSFDADIASAKKKRDTAEQKASEGGKAFEERTSGMSESQRMKFALTGQDEEQPEGNDKKTAASGVRPKKRTPNNDGDERGTVATGAGKKKRKVPGELVKSDAWGIAMSIGLRAREELRRTQAMHEPRFIVKSKPTRHVPFFFNEL